MAVGDPYASDGASGSQGDVLLRPPGWTRCGRQISMQSISIMSALSTSCTALTDAFPLRKT